MEILRKRNAPNKKYCNRKEAAFDELIVDWTQLKKASLSKDMSEETSKMGKTREKDKYLRTVGQLQKICV